MRPSSFLHTLSLAGRSFSRARGMAAIAVVTLAIGLASAVALMGMIDAGIRPLPVPDGDRIVELELRNARAEPVAAPAPLAEWAPGQGIEGAGALRQFQATLVHPSSGAYRLSGAAMHPSVLRLLRVPPALGRLPTNDVSDADAIVVSMSVWQELGADPSHLGSVVRVDGALHTLVGVMPEGFGFPERQSFWTVMPPTESGEVVARIADGADVDAAIEATQARVNAVAAAHGAEHMPYSVAAVDWTLSRESGGEGALFVGLSILVALLLVVCAANVSTLLLVRGEERSSVLAVHAALGATRARVGAQLFAEALLIAIGGGVLGLAAGAVLLHWMQANLSQHWGYYWMTMEVRAPVVLGTFAVVMVTCVLAGTVPALQAMRIDIARMLVSPGRGGQDPRRRRLGRWFVSAQVALSTVGLFVAVYLGWGAGQLERMTERLPMDNVAVASITMPQDRYTSPVERDALIAQLQRELRRLPGVSAVAIGTALPGGAGAMTELELPGDEPGESADRRVLWDAATDDLSDTYGMRLVAGRPLSADDDANRSRVALVSHATALRHFGGNAVGERIRLRGVHRDDAALGDTEWIEIVGVIENWSPGRDGTGVDRVILPLAQIAPARLTLSVRAADPRAVLAGMRSVVSGIDRELPLDELQTLQARMDWFLRMSRVIAAFGMFGGLASALVAAVGLYGVISFQVRSRTREIGIRMAVGAGTSRIAMLFVGESLRRVLPGLAVGFTMALFAVPLVSRFISGGSGSPDAVLMAAVLGGMLGIGVLAALHPAMRAARVHPQVVLRE